MFLGSARASGSARWSRNVRRGRRASIARSHSFEYAMSSAKRAATVETPFALQSSPILLTTSTTSWVPNMCRMSFLWTALAATHWMTLFSSGSPPKAPHPHFPLAIGAPGSLPPLWKPTNALEGGKVIETIEGNEEECQQQQQKGEGGAHLEEFAPNHRRCRLRVHREHEGVDGDDGRQERAVV